MFHSPIPPADPRGTYRTDGDQLWQRCDECGGAGYWFADSGPSGATIDCAYCDDGWWVVPVEEAA